jgi:hypothetical protein
MKLLSKVGGNMTSSSQLKEESASSVSGLLVRLGCMWIISTGLPSSEVYYV